MQSGFSIFHTYIFQGIGNHAMFEPAKFNMVLCDKRKLKKLIGIKINAKI